MRTCAKCGVSKSLDQFYRHPMAKEGRSLTCAECAKAAVRANRAERIEYYRAYDRTRAKQPNRVQARAEYAKEHPSARPEPDPVKRKARTAVGNAVRDGRLTKPATCDVCSQPSDVHGHHDDYSKSLDVIWCCTSCHAFIHAYWRAKERMAA